MKELNISKMRWIVISLIFSGTSFMRVQGNGNISQDQLKYFETHIRPALSQYCYECHSEESGKTKGGLLLDTREGMLQGGDYGNVLDGDSFQDTLLWDAITWNEIEMPPKNKMPQKVIDQFRTWIQMGAPDPRVREKFVIQSNINIEEGRNHWAFHKPEKKQNSTIDKLVDKSIKRHGLTPAPQADGYSILRRLHIDLIGLPPSLDEMNAFMRSWNRDKDRAIEEKVDDLLNRLQFGERWGRHWLDVARYAESSGHENFLYPHAWRYRDYVIRSFNEDLPYNIFIKEQLAGDLLLARTPEDKQRNLIATGFLAMGTKRLSERNPRVFRMDVIDEQIDTTTQAFLGLTVSCARCHDHKSDPIPTTDYYAMAGIFMSTETFYGTADGLQNRRSGPLLELPVPDSVQLTRSYTADEISEMKNQIRETQRNLAQARLEARRNGKQIEQSRAIFMRNQVSRLEAILANLDEGGKPGTYGMGVLDSLKMENAHVLLRGDVEKAAQKVDRGFLQVLDMIPTSAIDDRDSGRYELAEWIGSKENPLTARVMVNRVWQHLIGKPIVATPNNYGTSGLKPTHPELLDYLAIEFMDQNWSIKSLIKTIVQTDTYQRSSRHHATNYRIDPDNNFLWRAHTKNVDAESLRDSMLSISDSINLVPPHASAVAKIGDGRVGRRMDMSTFNDNNNHRSVYLPVLRDSVLGSMRLFDFADPNATNPGREMTIIPSQALYLMNNQMVLDNASKMAKNLMNDYSTTTARIQAAFLLAYSRPAKDSEISASVRFINTFEPEYLQQNNSSRGDRFRRNFRSRNGDNTQRPQRARFGNNFRNRNQANNKEEQVWSAFCQSLMASAEFRLLN